MSQSSAPSAGPQQPMTYPQQTYYEPKRPVEYLKPLTSDFLLAIGVVFGLFLMMIGGIIFGVADTSGGRDAGSILKSLGVFFLTAVLLMGAIVRVDVDKLVRFGFVLAAAFVVALVGFW